MENKSKRAIFGLVLRVPLLTSAELERALNVNEKTGDGRGERVQELERNSQRENGKAVIIEKNIKQKAKTKTKTKIRTAGS